MSDDPVDGESRPRMRVADDENVTLVLKALALAAAAIAFGASMSELFFH